MKIFERKFKLKTKILSDSFLFISTRRQLKDIDFDILPQTVLLIYSYTQKNETNGCLKNYQPGFSSMIYERPLLFPTL